MTFRVYNTKTHEDVTDKKDWFIDTCGDLRYTTTDTNKIGYPLAISNGDYYFKLEIEVI